MPVTPGPRTATRSRARPSPSGRSTRRASRRQPRSTTAAPTRKPSSRSSPTSSPPSVVRSSPRRPFPGETDMSPALTAIAAAKPELLYFPVFVAEGGFIAQALETPGLEDVIRIGSDGMFTPDFVTAPAPAPRGCSCRARTSRRSRRVRRVPREAHCQVRRVAGQRVPRSRVRRDEHPVQRDREGRGPEQRRLAVDPQGALRQAIFATKDFPGLTGVLTCSPTGDCGAPLIAVYEITARETGGEWPPAAPIWPTEYRQPLNYRTEPGDPGLGSHPGPEKADGAG